MARKKKTDLVAPDPPAATGVDGTSVTDAPRPEPQRDQQEKRRPSFALKCASGKDTWIEVAVWENEVAYQDGGRGTQLVTSFSRSYRNGEGWKTNFSFRQHDLPVLGFLLDRAHAWILERRAVHDVPF